MGQQWIGRLFDEDAALARFITLSVQALGDLRPVPLQNSLQQV